MSVGDKQHPDKQAKIVKLMIFAAVLVLLGLPVAVWIALEPVVGPMLFPPQWKQDFDKGTEQFSEDRDGGETLIKKALAEADEAKAPVAVKMRMHRDYATLLYNNDDPDDGDEQIKEAIALVPGDPPPNSDEASELIDLHQARALSQHEAYVKDPGATPGIKDEEMAASIAEKAFGATSKQAANALAHLGLIYADMNMPEKADATFARARKALETNPSAKAEEWTVYTMMARAKAYERNYKDAIDAYLRALRANKDSELDALAQLTEGLQSGRRDEDNTPQVHDQLEAQDYGALDAAAQTLRKSEQRTPEGFWKLDEFYDALEDEYKSGDKQELATTIGRFKQWVSEKPHSPVARLALAKCYLWDASANQTDTDDEQSEQQAQLYKARIAEAQRLVDDDPGIKRQCPKAFEVFAEIANERDSEKDSTKSDDDQKENYLKLVEECRRLWPAYKTLELRAGELTPAGWYLADDNLSSFAKSCADRIGGAKGDEFYAQAIYQATNYYHNIFSDDTKVDWDRVKRGCKQIIADFPQDIQARLIMVDLAGIKGDDEAVRTAFNGLKN
ncbi:MAG TPA: hypothetical protein V6D22_18015 [Candidatus Obscuribacterales bacterium]